MLFIFKKTDGTGLLSFGPRREIVILHIIFNKYTVYLIINIECATCVPSLFPAGLHCWRLLYRHVLQPVLLLSDGAGTQGTPRPAHANHLLHHRAGRIKPTGICPPLPRPTGLRSATIIDRTQGFIFICITVWGQVFRIKVHFVLDTQACNCIAAELCWEIVA